MPIYDSAFRTKTSHAPTAATSTPAMAGPMARETLIAMLFSATADDSSSGRNEVRHDRRPGRHHDGGADPEREDEAEQHPRRRQVEQCQDAKRAGDDQQVDLERRSAAAADRRCRRSRPPAARAASPEGCQPLPPAPPSTATTKARSSASRPRRPASRCRRSRRSWRSRGCGRAGAVAGSTRTAPRDRDGSAGCWIRWLRRRWRGLRRRPRPFAHPSSITSSST